jgi:hypothetical protein
VLAAAAGRGIVRACVAGAVLLAIGGGIQSAEADTRVHDRGRSGAIVAPAPKPPTGYVPFHQRPVVMRKREQQQPPRRPSCSVRPCAGG